MALHFDLPVYKSSYDLFINIFQVTKNFAKEYKYTVGEKIKNETIELTTNIYRANISISKKEYLQKARENIEIIRLMFRLMKDLKQISLKSFTFINLKIEDVSKQLTNWQKTSN